ncbi:hypothetical protein B0T16DRAFT_62384 [Cercophora newfieldiana]|uniref:Uncharacterized protein n=1 Tax=Cercophora newfieldiana TaxID=92897 RepID=A0AA39YTU3_9PEZI|nr:hypothetical protein B0T16DRAFT_62384 [Cercophora newfieldiana]
MSLITSFYPSLPYNTTKIPTLFPVPLITNNTDNVPHTLAKREREEREHASTSVGSQAGSDIDLRASFLRFLWFSLAFTPLICTYPFWKRSPPPCFISFAAVNFTGFFIFSGGVEPASQQGVCDTEKFGIGRSGVCEIWCGWFMLMVCGFEMSPFPFFFHSDGVWFSASLTSPVAHRTGWKKANDFCL